MVLSNYRFETFPAALDDGTPDPRMVDVARAGHAAFHEVDSGEVLSKRSAQAAADRDSEITAAYRVSGTVDRALRNRPHATLHHYIGTVNVGAGQMLKAGMLTYAAVRSTDRRRGLLRELMERNLHSIARKGISVVLLLASEGGIYGRFGFQPVYRTAQLTIGETPTFALEDYIADRVRESGRVEEVTLPWLLAQVDALTAQVHRQERLSINRQQGFSEGLYYQSHIDQLDPRVRAAVHLNQKGRVDGFVTFKVERESDGRSAHLLELLGTNPLAELALWDYVANLDLVSKTVSLAQPVDTPLTLAARDPRSIHLDHVGDYLWARILDPVEALLQRAYTSAAREAQLGLRFTVSDPLGYAAGTFEVQLDQEGSTVAKIERSTTSLKLTERALAALIFGSDSAANLASAGMIIGATTDVIDHMDSLFAPVGPARCTGDF